MEAFSILKPILRAFTIFDDGLIVRSHYGFLDLEAFSKNSNSNAIALSAALYVTPIHHLATNERNMAAIQVDLIQHVLYEVVLAFHDLVHTRPDKVCWLIYM